MCLLRDNVQCYTSTSAGPGETELGKYTPVQSRAARLMEAYRGGSTDNLGGTEDGPWEQGVITPADYSRKQKIFVRLS